MRRAAAAALLVALAWAEGAVASPVRVRIAEAATAVELLDASGERHFVRSSGSGLEVDGSGVGRRHVFAAERGPFQVVEKGGPAKPTGRYRGALVFERRGAGFDVVNHVGLEDYVAGTLGGEMFSSWAPAALRAQAVACRSFVLYQAGLRTKESFDVAADVSSQRYLGMGGESDATWAAVRATQSEVLFDAAGPVLAAFHSASGGRTASAAEVWGTPISYLRSVPVDSEDASPDTYWRAEIAAENLAQALDHLGFEVGKIEEIEVTRRSGSGRAAEVRFRGQAGRAKVTGRELRQALGANTIRSTMFDVRKSESAFVFVGSGYGHGVGMSQWAAQGMALEGASYTDILQKFYPGTRLAPHLATARHAVQSIERERRNPPAVAARRDARTSVGGSNEAGREQIGPNQIADRKKGRRVNPKGEPRP